MGGPTGTANSASSGGLSSAATSGTNANNFGTQNSGLFSTLFGTPGGNASTGGGTLSGMMNPSSLNISSPTGPYALQYQQAKANNALGTQQNAQAINRQAGNSGFGAGAPAGYTGYLQSQNTQAGNTNAGNLFSQYAGQSYQDALNNFWKANQMRRDGHRAVGKSAEYGTRAGESNILPALWNGSGSRNKIAAKRWVERRRRCSRESHRREGVRCQTRRDSRQPRTSSSKN